MAGYELPEGWRWDLLGNVGPIDTIGLSPRDQPEELFNYVALENIASGTGRLINFKPTKGETIRSNKFIFNERHVLLGKLRPYLNKVFVPNFSGICATDILPLLPNPEDLTREFLAICLRSPNFIEYSKVKMEGAKMPRLRTPDLEAYEIPIPPLSEQQRIVARIDELTRHIEGARQLRRQAVDEIGKILASSVSNKIRGNKDHWEETTLENILSMVQYGTSVKASREPKGFPVIRMGNIQENKVKTTDLKYIDFPLKEAARYLLQKDDILINRTNSADLVGKAGLFEAEGKYIFASYLIRLKVDSDVADPAFVNYCINSEDGQAFLKCQGKDAIGQTNINTKQIRQMPLRLPPLNEQRQIVVNLNRLQAKAEDLRRLQAETEAELAAFTPALLAKAFRGEL
jgi:type I restriction enzyme S subunit